MSKATYPLKLPMSIKKAAQRLAKEDGVSLNQWIAVAVAEKVGVTETAADFFKRRAGKATGEGLMRFLRTAPRSRPEAEDQRRPAQVAARRCWLFVRRRSLSSDHWPSTSKWGPALTAFFSGSQ